MHFHSTRAGFLALLFAAAAHAQFPLGPGGNGPQVVVDPLVNEFIAKAIVEDATGTPFCGNAATVELVSARRQGELVFVFSRVSWTDAAGRWRAARSHVAEVQYSMVQRRLNHCVYEIWCRETRPRVYEHYDLSRARTRINEELHRYDKIAGDTAFPGPYPRGPSTLIPQYMPPAAASPTVALPAVPPPPLVAPPPVKPPLPPEPAAARVTPPPKQS